MSVGTLKTVHKPKCLPTFKHINRYWDKSRQIFIAKIQPGEYYVTVNDEAVATTLGSCVSACIWDQQGNVGGMNHFMLPLTEKESHEVTWGQKINTSSATRFGNHAMEQLINEILKNGGRRRNLKAKVFGGGKILRNMGDIGKKNIEFALKYLEIENIPIISHDLGSDCPRKVLFIPRSGRALIKRLKNLHNDTIFIREEHYHNHIINKPIEGDLELF